MLILWKKMKDSESLFSGILFGGFGLSIFIGICLGLYNAIQIEQYGLIFVIIIIFLETVTDTIVVGCILSCALCLAIIMYFIIRHFIQAAAYTHQTIKRESKRAGNMILIMIVAISVVSMIFYVNKLLYKHNNNDRLNLKTNTNKYVCENTRRPYSQPG